jgi:CRISPR-associated endonuclease/helicase Cas3
MPELSAPRFPEFFEALWGYPPFAWQSELTRRAVEDHASPWPQAIALPTAAGKTACIDVAVFALAARLSREGDIVRSPSARRIFFVVDRRVIVDEAFERAHEIADKLARAKDGILQEVAGALRQIAHGRAGGWQDEQPLLAFQLRGGMYRSEAWARSPLQPIVVASTVDQVGSRLLFRAYGRGSGMRPVHAGLVANDSLIFLDEAHCARPFMETLHAVGAYRKVAQEPVPVPFFPVVLSATPPSSLSDVFRDASGEPSDPAHPLGRRQLARKPAALVRPIRRDGASRSSDSFVAALVEQALDLATEDRKAVVVFVNRVATARGVYALLREGGRDPILLTGRMRPFDKDDAVRDRLSALSARVSETRNLTQPIFVVATQTLEVGADLDFDALVTECASLDALRQRFGRLNRKGRAVAARAAILIREDQVKNSDDDPVYGAALGRTWAWLGEQADTHRTIDFGIAHLDQRLPRGAELEVLNAPSASAPKMLPAHLDFLSQTSPIPVPSPEVAYFLHGPSRASADVHVCWRVDLDLDDPTRDERVLDLLTHCPPASPECLPVPLWRMRRWLLGQADVDASTDIEGERSEEDAPEQGPNVRRRVVRWRGREDAEVISRPSELRPGDVIVIAAGAGGWQELGDLPDSAAGGRPVLDWGDRAYRALRARALLRLHERLIAAWPVAEYVRTAFLSLLENLEQELETDAEAFLAELQERLRSLAQATVPVAWHWLPEVAGFLAKERDSKLLRNLSIHPFRGLILRGSRALPVQQEQPDAFSDEHDASASGTVAVPLADHLPGVADFARRFADGVGLPDAQADAVELAALVHDLGKADPRFQALLRGGQRFVGGDLLAKSGALPQGRIAFERARRLSGYPEGGRHELLSVRLAEGAEDLLPQDPMYRALVLHLVASHHGYCRPFAPVVMDLQPVAISFELLGRTWAHDRATGLERLDSGVAERFWSLTRRYGWWGLAWIEALLRLGDHRRSEWEQDHLNE